MGSTLPLPCRHVSRVMSDLSVPYTEQFSGPVCGKVVQRFFVIFAVVLIMEIHRYWKLYIHK